MKELPGFLRLLESNAIGAGDAAAFLAKFFAAKLVKFGWIWAKFAQN